MPIVLLDRNGPDWPLGLIVVATPGTPVAMMSNVDAANDNAPQTETPPIPNSATRPQNEYTATCQQIMIQGYKAGASHGLQNNTGNIYVVRKGGGTRDEYGAMVVCVAPGQTIYIAAAPNNLNVLSPYRYVIDADNAGDSALVTLLVQ